ncbi:MAG: DUF3109 family protein [Planctomycetes bacterium]|nr:DUF3109 family protein [Planctomycetota bacterium]
MTPETTTRPEVTNLETARFECVYPTCGGTCCSNGRPPIEAAEQARIQEHLAKFLPHMRPEARAKVEKEGFVTKRRKEGLFALGVSKGWCVFANDGCVLHKVGAVEGDRWKYKPWRCITFPLERSENGKWHVRQWKLKGEAWDLFCLNPAESPKKPAETLKSEIEFLEELEGGRESWRRQED